MKIRCYTVVSPSHRKLLENYMLPSFPNEPNMEMTIKYIEQHCPSSEFESPGWHKVMQEKAKCFYDTLLDLKDGELMMFIDTDIIHLDNWYNDMVEHMKNVDLAVQNDYGGGLNSGFFCVRKTTATINLFRAVHEFIGQYSNEQKALTFYTLNHDKYVELRDLRWKFLPREYWTFGENMTHYDGTQIIVLPPNPKIAHLNWTKTFALKSDLGDIVKSLIPK